MTLGPLWRGRTSLSRRPRHVLPISVAIIAVAAAACSEPERDRPDIGTTTAALTEVTGFGSNPGNLRMFEYVPAGLPSGAPLVVAMHGCTQSAAVYSVQTEWNELADRFGFAVVYPEQRSANNGALCFSWFQLADTTRGQGEVLSVAQMVGNMKSRHGSDAARVFVTGMSSGGYMAEAMMATYPDLFAGGAVNSGGAYRCATSINDSSPCQLGNVSRTPQQWGDLVRNAFPGYSGPYPRLVAFHGSSDFTVAPPNLVQSVDQWSNVLGIDSAADVDETFRSARHRIYRDGSGSSAIETYLIDGMGHAITVDPGTAADQGGATGAFSQDRDIYSAYYAAVFWGLTGTGGSPDAGGGSPDAAVPDAGPDEPDAGGVALVETFSAGDGPDNPGWALGAWTLDTTRDATGSSGSRSVAGVARPAFNTVTQTATWSNLGLGAAPVLRYARQLSLSGANLSASTSFRVIVNDGADHIVDSRSTTGLGSAVESSWTERSVDLSAFAGQTITLKLVVTATDPASTITSARAWVDDIQLE
jgi:poly(hydroxyalkanoate) depolymerase family esterase